MGCGCGPLAAVRWGRNSVFPRRATGSLASGIHRHLTTFHVESAAGAALGEERFDSGLGHHLNALISSIT